MRGLTFNRANDGPKAGARREVQSERFTRYFPRLFAYGCAFTGDDQAARDVVVTAFSEAFAMPDMREEEFEMELFRTTRAICQSGEFRVRRHNDGLSPRERDVVSLLFDGQLNRVQISALLGIKQEAVAATLVRGLRKLRTTLATSGAGAAMPSFS
ncbi:MAG: sigma factor-like helix-turn-helix DNA-binding protein [Chloroflexota bacterium]